jgi:hypothetical protein
MDNRKKTEKIFTENVDRLIAGKEVLHMSEEDRDLNSALDFARLMRHRQPQPSERFQSELRERLLIRLGQKSLPEFRPPWWQKVVPHQPLWQAVSAVFILLVLVGVVLGILWRPGSHETIIQAPTPTPSLTPTFSTTTAKPATTSTTSATMTTTSAATTAPAPGVSFTFTTTPSATFPAGVKLLAAAQTEKTRYALGEPVNIKVTLTNTGPTAIYFAQFPPILSLMAADGQPVLSFLAGKTGLTIQPGSSMAFSQTWQQNDAHGNSVPAGRYYLELEDMDLQGQAIKLNLIQPVSFEIGP